MWYYFNCRVRYSFFWFIFSQLKNEEKKKSNTLFSINSLTVNPFTCTMERNSSCWLTFLTIYSLISFSLSSLSHMFMVHQYPDVPWMCTDFAIPRWNFKGMIKPAVHFCISLLKADSNGNNCQEQHMDRVHRLRGREREGSSENRFCASACVFVARSKTVQRTCTTEIWRWFVEWSQ